MNNKGITIRMDSETLDKLHYAASYEGRSANMQVVTLIRRCIEEYEKAHGVIELGGQKNDPQSNNGD